MGKRRIEKYLPKAIKLIENGGFLKDKEIPGVYNGYISSFGASIIQSGLLATSAFYENQQSKSEQNREKVTKVILKLIDEKANTGRLFDYLQKKKITPELTDKIRDAAVALKLGIRTFKLADKEGEKGGE